MLSINEMFCIQKCLLRIWQDTNPGDETDLEGGRGLLDEAEDGPNVVGSAVVRPGRELVVEDLPHTQPCLLLLDLGVADPQHSHREVGLKLTPLSLSLEVKLFTVSPNSSFLRKFILSFHKLKIFFSAFRHFPHEKWGNENPRLYDGDIINGSDIWR